MTATLTYPDRSSMAVRVVPVPRSEPPTDDEREPGVPAAPPMTAPPLPLDLATGAQVQRGRRQRDGRRSIGAGDRPAGFRWGDGDPHPVNPAGRSGGQGRPGSGGRVGPGAPHDDPEALGPVDLRSSIRLLLAACVEVVGGYRPLAQLRPFCVPERYDSIVNRLLRPAGCANGRGFGATRTSVVAGQGPPGRSGPPARTGRPAAADPRDRVTLRRVQTCDVSEAVAELAVVMARGDRVWAMALRLEYVHGRWLCTHLEVI
jgi:hypothetical protein